MTHSGVARELREEIGLSEALIRVSIGIENVEGLDFRSRTRPRIRLMAGRIPGCLRTVLHFPENANHATFLT